MRGKVVDNEKRKRAAEDMGDAMRALKNRANHSKQDMDILAALEEMRSMKSRHAGVSVNRMLEILKHSTHLKEEKIVADLDDEDEELIKSITSRNSKDYVKRIEDDDGDEDFVIPGQLRFMAEDGVHWLVEHLLPKSMLFQVEYAIEAIKLGSTTVRLKTKDGVVLAGEERVTSSLLLQTFLTERGLD